MSSANVLSMGIVDDHPLLWDAIRALITAEQGWKVTWTSADVPGAVAALAKLQTDLVIVDLSLKESHGLDLIKNLQAIYPTIKVLVYSQHPETQYAERSIRSGAMGYLMKSEQPAELVNAIRTVASGEIYLSQTMGKVLNGDAARRGFGQQQAKEAPELTDRELTVLDLIGQAMTTRQIATCLVVSLKTVDAHRSNLKRKLGLKSGSELVCYATLRMNTGR